MSNECRAKSFHPVALSLLVALASVILSHHVGYYQFGGYDLSPVIDVMYRLANGETPGRDFINTLPLSFLAYLDVAQFFLGVNWSTLIWAGSALFAATSMIVIYFGKVFLEGPLRVAAVAILAVPLLFTNHVWHNVFSAYVAVIFLVFFLGCLTSARPRPSYWIGAALSAGVLFYSKQNVGLPLSILLILFCAFRAWRFRDWAALAMIAVMFGSIAATTGLYMALLGVNTDAIAHIFGATKGRLIPSKQQLSEALAGPAPWIVALALLYVLGALHRMPASAFRRDVPVVCGFCLVLGGLTFLTNWDCKYNDVVLLMLPLAIILGTSAHAGGMEDGHIAIVRGRRSLFLATGVLVVVAATAGVTRQRMEAVGYGAFFERAPLTRIEGGLFSGLWVGPRMASARAELRDFVDRHPDARASLFCGPRIEFCYADLGAVSPRGFPLWWHPGSSYAMRDEHRLEQHFVVSKPKYLAFIRGDRTRMPRAVLDHVGRCYERTRHDGVLEFYIRTCR